MKTKTITLALALTALTAIGQAAQAQDRDRGGDRPQSEGHDRWTDPHQGVPNRPQTAPAQAPQVRSAPAAGQAPTQPPPAVRRDQNPRFGGPQAGVQPPPAQAQFQTGRGDRGGQDRGGQYDPRRAGGDGRDRRPDEGRDRRFDDGRDGYRGRDGDHDRWRDPGPRWTPGRYPPIYEAQRRYRFDRYYAPRGYYVRSWIYGDFLPSGWFGRSYWLNWYDFGLPSPPPGFEWVRVGDDALLIDEYSGRVIQVVRRLFW